MPCIKANPKKSKIFFESPRNKAHIGLLVIVSFWFPLLQTVKTPPRPEPQTKQSPNLQRVHYNIQSQVPLPLARLGAQRRLSSPELHGEAGVSGVPVLLFCSREENERVRSCSSPRTSLPFLEDWNYYLYWTDFRDSRLRSTSGNQPDPSFNKK